MIIDAFERWLPYPVYPFVGGPNDGESLEVTLVETPRGMVPLEYWNVAEKVPGARSGMPPGAIPHRCVVRHATYRFVPRAGTINQGHYAFVE